MAEVRYYASKVVVDVTCVVLLGICIIVFKFIGVPYKRGFFCDDETINHPFKDSTVTSLTLYFVGTSLNLIAFLILEAYKVRQRKLPPHVIGAYRIHPYVWELYRTIGTFAFGCCISQLTTDIGKYTIGRLRPHFLSVCKPNLQNIICSMANTNVYVTEYECLGDASKVREARLSFPSGHSSFSAFTMVFLTLYLQSRLTCKQFKLLKPLLQFIALMLAMATALSRISDYKHHWSDVLAGSFQGTIVALLIVLFVSDFFKPQKEIKYTSTVLPMTEHVEARPSTRPPPPPPSRTKPTVTATTSPTSSNNE